MEHLCKLMKENEKDTNEQKDILCSWTGNINVVQLSILSKVIHTLNAILFKMWMSVFKK
jgi:hypothetical protein